MPNNAAPDPSEFYKKCFEIENNLTRNILKAIRPANPIIGLMNALARPVKLPGRSFEDFMCVSIWFRSASAT